jgi:hypothetical protein
LSACWTRSRKIAFRSQYGGTANVYIQIRAAIIALAPDHPYLRLPVQFATSLKCRILDGGLMNEAELDKTIAECERVISNSQTVGTSFVVMQLRGRKPT